MCSRVISFLRICKVRPVHHFIRGYNSEIPITPKFENQDKHKVHVDKNTVALLERLSLVKFETDEAVKVLEDSIEFADQILHINTDGVEPLYTVLEDKNLSLREDKVTEGNCQKDILKNAALTEDEYFIAPPGNIPLHEVAPETNSKNPPKITEKSQKLKQNEN